MPVRETGRAGHMLQRLRRTANRCGVPDTALLEAAFRAAMAPRDRLLDDDHDPRYLHPGRTALVAMEDAGLTEPLALAAGILLETEDPSLACVEPTAPGGGRPDLREAWALAGTIPGRRAEGLAEGLLLAEEGLRIVALSEALDQLRHLRLWAPASEVRAASEVAARVYLPVAERTHPTLHRRFRWWVDRMGPDVSAS